MASHGDYVTFLFTAPNKSFGFKTYTNHIGQAEGFIEGYDRDKMPIYRRWKFDNDVRKITVHKNKTDLTQKNAVEFLKNSPNCKGSPNGTYSPDGTQVDIYFEEVNEAKSAAVGLELEKLRIDAQNAALKVKDQDFVDLCALIGIFNKDETIMRFALVDYAKNKPQSFLEIYSDPTRQIRSVVRAAIHNNIFNKQGTLLTWENTMIGTDEDDAVARLSKDDKLLKAIKANIEKIK